MNTVIRSLATANPERYLNGQEALKYFKENWNLSPQEEELYEKVLINGPIKGRYIGVEHDKFSALADQDQLIEHFTTQARRLNYQASLKSLEQGQIDVSDIQAVVVNTCTGYVCPGLSSYLIDDMGLASSTKVFDLMGMGCGAAIPNLEFASSLANQCGGSVLSVAVEVCSATIFDSPDPGCIISNCIFGDGVSAAVVSREEDVDRPLAKIIDIQAGIFPQYRENLRFVSDKGKLRNVLSRRVPIIGADVIREVAMKLLERNDLTVDDIDRWAVHPGGTAVLEKVQERLGLTSDEIHHSLEVFKNYGNMSSPSVMFVLNRLFDECKSKSNQLCCALSFGAGFSAHAALLHIPGHVNS